MLKLIRANLSAAKIEQKIFTSEEQITAEGYVEEALKLLTDKDLIYQGVLEAPKGEKNDDWEAREQTLFKSTEFGDDTDRALKKADGSYTYLAGDLRLPPPQNPPRFYQAGKRLGHRPHRLCKAHESRRFRPFRPQSQL